MSFAPEVCFTSRCILLIAKFCFLNWLQLCVLYVNAGSIDIFLKSKKDKLKVSDSKTFTAFFCEKSLEFKNDINDEVLNSNVLLQKPQSTIEENF